jgi:predicted PurR-regulated permease PerM
MSPPRLLNFPAFWLLVGLLLVGAWQVVTPFLSSIMWGTVLSVLLYPLFARVKPRFGASAAAWVSVLVATLVIVIPFGGIGVYIGFQVNSHVREVTDTNGSYTLTQLAEELDKMSQPVAAMFGAPNFTVSKWAAENSELVQEWATNFATEGAKGFVLTLAYLFISLMSMFFMIRDGHKLLPLAFDIFPFKREQTQAMLVRQGVTIQSVFFGIIVVSLIQAGLATLGYVLAGAEQWLLWGIITFVFACIPFIGAPAGYVPVGILLFANGRTTEGVILMAFCFGVISNIDGILRMIFIGDRAKLPQLPLFFALIGGVFAFGPVGIMAGPMILAAGLSLIDFHRARLRAMKAAEDPEEAKRQAAEDAANEAAKKPEWVEKLKRRRKTD